MLSVVNVLCWESLPRRRASTRVHICSRMPAKTAGGNAVSRIRNGTNVATGASSSNMLRLSPRFQVRNLSARPCGMRSGKDIKVALLQSSSASAVVVTGGFGPPALRFAPSSSSFWSRRRLRLLRSIPYKSGGWVGMMRLTNRWTKIRSTMFFWRPLFLSFLLRSS